MRRARNSRPWLAWLLLAATLSHAGDVDVPELGVRLGAVPGELPAPQITRRPAGIEMTVRLGAAVLSVYRDNEPVAPGSDVANPHYRATLDARFDHSIGSDNTGAPTTIGGHSGWTVVDSRDQGAGQLTVYTCLTYVIVDTHLYRFAVRATAALRPPEFDTLVRALSAVSFEPVRRT